MLEYNSDERLFVCGATGEGKSELVRRVAEGVLAAGGRMVVSDPKESRPMRLFAPTLWRPGLFPAPGQAMRVVGRNREEIDRMAAEAFRRGNCTALFDDIYLVSSPQKWPGHMMDIAVAGRERGVGAIFNAQRPRNIPPWVTTEATVIVTFRLARQEDRDFLADNTQADNWEEAKDLAPHEWMVWRVGTREAVRMAPLSIPDSPERSREDGAAAAGVHSKRRASRARNS